MPLYICKYVQMCNAHTNTQGNQLVLYREADWRFYTLLYIVSEFQKDVSFNSVCMSVELESMLL